MSERRRRRDPGRCSRVFRLFFERSKATGGTEAAPSDATSGPPDEGTKESDVGRACPVYLGVGNEESEEKTRTRKINSFRGGVVDDDDDDDESSTKGKTKGTSPEVNGSVTLTATRFQRGRGT